MLRFCPCSSFISFWLRRASCLLFLTHIPLQVQCLKPHPTPSLTPPHSGVCVNIYKPLKASMEAGVCNHTERVCLTLNQRRCYCPCKPGPLHQETSEWLLRNVLVNALNIRSKGSNISMLTLEEGRVFDNLTQLYRWMERLLPRGSPREGGESAGAWWWMCSASMPPHTESSSKWPRKGIQVHSESSSPLRTFTPQMHKAPNSQIDPI